MRKRSGNGVAGRRSRELSPFPEIYCAEDIKYEICCMINELTGEVCEELYIDLISWFAEKGL